MAEESHVIPPRRLVRWILLCLLIAGGVVLYFRDGAHVPTFGTVAPPPATDSTR